MKIQGTRRATSSTAKACWPIRAWGDAMRASVGGFQSQGAPDVHVTAGEAEMSSAVSLSPAIIWQPGTCCRPPCPPSSASCCFLFLPSVLCQVAPSQLQLSPSTSCPRTLSPVDSCRHQDSWSAMSHCSDGTAEVATLVPMWRDVTSSVGGRGGWRNITRAFFIRQTLQHTVLSWKRRSLKRKCKRELIFERFYPFLVNFALLAIKKKPKHFLGFWWTRKKIILLKSVSKCLYFSLLSQFFLTSDCYLCKQVSIFIGFVSQIFLFNVFIRKFCCASCVMN